MKYPSLHQAMVCVFSGLLMSACAGPGVESERGGETAPEGLSVLAPEVLRSTRGAVSFEHQVKPILESKCLSCHSDQAAAGAYRLESRDMAMQPGAYGPRIVPGRPGSSRLLQVTAAHQGVVAMPLVGARLTPSEEKILWRWIQQGAPWPEGVTGALRPSLAELHPQR